MAFSTKSIQTLDTDNSRKGGALAALNSSYMVYNNITWSWWMAPYQGINKNWIAMWETSTSALRSWLFSAQTDRTARLIFSWDGTSFSLDKTTQQVLDGAWSHWAITFLNGNYSIYKNAVKLALTNSIPWGGGAAGLFAANVQWGIGTIDPFNPPVDSAASMCANNFAMFNTVLNSSQIVELYNGGEPGDLARHSAAANRISWVRADQTVVNSTLIDTMNAGANMQMFKSGANAVFDPSTSHAVTEVIQTSAVKAFLFNGGSLEDVVEASGIPISSAYIVSINVDLATNKLNNDGGKRAILKSEVIQGMRTIEQYIEKDPNGDFG